MEYLEVIVLLSLPLLDSMNALSEEFTTDCELLEICAEADESSSKVVVISVIEADCCMEIED